MMPVLVAKLSEGEGTVITIVIIVLLVLIFGVLLITDDTNWFD